MTATATATGTASAGHLLVVSQGNRSATETCPWLNGYAVRRPTRAYSATKRAIDLGFVALAAPVAIPVAAFSALALKIENPKAPVLFKQERTGLGGQRFTVLKFRSMVPNAEELKAELSHMNQRQWPDFKIAKDPRVTRVGHLLRKLSFDEVPQFWNVLRGEMSMVGPRPTFLLPSDLEPWQNERFAVKPGVTGLWQVAGRQSTAFLDRMRLDIAYVSRQSLRLDLAIIVRTIPAVVLGRGSV